VIEDTDGKLWIGTLGQGLDSFDGRGFHAITTKQGLIDNAILSLERDSDGDLWVGTKNGISRLRHGVPIASYSEAQGLSGREVHALFVDAQGVLWAGTDRGLDRFNGKYFVQAGVVPDTDKSGVVALNGGRTVRLFASVGAPGLYLLRDNAAANHALDISHPIDCYYLDSARHVVWMGTLGSGLLRWSNGKISHVRVKDGLYDNRIYSILKDDSANFWLASSKGIFRVSEGELEAFAESKVRSVTSIPFSTGQLHFECRAGVQPAACRTRDGRLWFSTTGGVVMIDPNHLHNNAIAPPVSITAVLVNGRRVNPHRSIQIKPSETNNLEIHYAGLSFISPEKMTFEYRLDGYDKTWIDAGTRREAFFTNLPPGQFRFLVRARNADGIESIETAGLPFTVEPKLYQRWWFIPLLALMMGLAAATWYRLRIRRLKLSFDLVLAERSRIARELHDTLLQGLSGITMQLHALWIRLPASKERLFLREIIQDAGKCASEARQSLWGLRTIGPGSSDISAKLERLVRQSTMDKRISLSLDIERVSLSSAPEAEFQLLRIAQEAISNVLRHSRALELTVSLKVRDGSLVLIVEDDGVGFVESAEPHSEHFGLVGMRERAAEIGAELRISSLPKHGTKVCISLHLEPFPAAESNESPPIAHQIR